MFNLMPLRRGQRGPTTHRGHPLDLLRQEFDSMFDHFFGHWPALTEMGDEMHAMRFWDLSTTESDTEFVVTAEVPGFDANELDVQLNDNLLTIEAQRKQESEVRKEFNHFRRSVTLPHGLDAERAQASYRNGVLELRFPRTPQAKGRRIPIQTSAAQPPARPDGQESQAAPQQATAQAKGSQKKS